ncbi:MAG: Flp family type IVb pilin [Candidatus Velamenicoccus archaeovorus]
MLLSTITAVTVWFNDLRTRAHEERGATAVEYALMVALIAAVIIGVVTVLGTNSQSKFSTVASAVGGAS